MRRPHVSTGRVSHQHAPGSDPRHGSRRPTVASRHGGAGRGRAGRVPGSDPGTWLLRGRRGSHRPAHRAGAGARPLDYGADAADPPLTGSRIAVVTVPDDALVLRPPPPGPAVDDVGSALRDALRFPLAGEPLEALAPHGGRATVVVEPPALPIPSAERDPRQDAVAAAVDELERLGIPTRSQTILVAGGLARRVDARRLDALFSPEFARRFHGTVEVHDVERPDLVEVGEAAGVPLRVHPALVGPTSSSP